MEARNARGDARGRTPQIELGPSKRRRERSARLVRSARYQRVIDSGRIAPLPGRTAPAGTRVDVPRAATSPRPIQIRTCRSRERCGDDSFMNRRAAARSGACGTAERRTRGGTRLACPIPWGTGMSQPRCARSSRIDAIFWTIPTSLEEITHSSGFRAPLR